MAFVDAPQSLGLNGLAAGLVLAACGTEPHVPIHGPDFGDDDSTRPL